MNVEGSNPFARSNSLLVANIFVYALRFVDGAIYVGLTKDLSRRLKEHARRQSPSTKRFEGDFELFYQESFPGYVEARAHEKFLKSGAGRKLLASVSK